MPDEDICAPVSNRVKQVDLLNEHSLCQHAQPVIASAPLKHNPDSAPLTSRSSAFWE